jgi:hypothetical protein
VFGTDAQAAQPAQQPLALLPWHLFQHLQERADLEGRSLSILTAHQLEATAMDDLAHLGRPLVDATAAAEAHGCLPRVLQGLVSLGMVELMFTGRELFLLALDQELENSVI